MSATPAAAPTRAVCSPRLPARPRGASILRWALHVTPEVRRVMELCTAAESTGTGSGTAEGDAGRESGSTVTTEDIRRRLKDFL